MLDVRQNKINWRTYLLLLGITCGGRYAYAHTISYYANTAMWVV